MATLEWFEENGIHIAYGTARCYRVRYKALGEFAVTIDNFPVGTDCTLERAKILAQQHNDR